VDFYDDVMSPKAQRDTTGLDNTLQEGALIKC